MIVAIDGPAGSGKSSTAKLISRKLGWKYLDTGAMFVLLESSASKYSYEIRKEVQRVLHNSKSHMFFTK